MSYSSKFFVATDALIDMYNQSNNTQRFVLVAPLIKSLVSTGSQVGAELDYWYARAQELEKRLKDIETEKYKKHIQDMKDYEN